MEDWRRTDINEGDFTREEAIRIPYIIKNYMPSLCFLLPLAT